MIPKSLSLPCREDLDIRHRIDRRRSNQFPRQLPRLCADDRFVEVFQDVADFSKGMCDAVGEEVAG